jgi:hypothetical protein
MEIAFIYPGKLEEGLFVSICEFKIQDHKKGLEVSPISD